MSVRKLILLVVGVLILGTAIFVYKREATGHTNIVCGPTQYACPCATGSYCIPRGAMCLTPSSACPTN